jgi:hypothetical protein
MNRLEKKGSHCAPWWCAAQERVVADMNTRGSGVVSAVPSTLKATASSSGSSSSGHGGGASAAAAAPVLPSAGPLYTVEDVSKLVEELQRLH